MDGGVRVVRGEGERGRGGGRQVQEDLPVPDPAGSASEGGSLAGKQMGTTEVVMLGRRRRSARSDLDAAEPIRSEVVLEEVRENGSTAGSSTTLGHLDDSGNSGGWSRGGGRKGAGQSEFSGDLAARRGLEGFVEVDKDGSGYVPDEIVAQCAYPCVCMCEA